MAQWSDEGAVVGPEGSSFLPQHFRVTEMTCSNTNLRSRAIRPKPLHMPLDQPGRLRVGHLMFLYGCSHQTIYNRLKCALIPPADGHDPRPYWLTSTILPHFQKRGAA